MSRDGDAEDRQSRGLPRLAGCTECEGLARSGTACHHGDSVSVKRERLDRAPLLGGQGGPGRQSAFNGGEVGLAGTHATELDRRLDQAALEREVLRRRVALAPAGINRPPRRRNVSPVSRVSASGRSATARSARNRSAARSTVAVSSVAPGGIASHSA
jgi:hypothetical protein